jgi:hypothetical protein
MTRVFALLALVPAASFAASCISTADCTEWITFGHGPARSKVYRTYPLETRNENIRRALVVVHGAGRDADNYFRTAVAAAFLAGALDDTIVIAPRIASNEGRSCADHLDADEVNWPCGGNSWRAGGISTNQSTLTSFDFADEILKKLARKEIFPNLKGIVFTGHSAGGQFTTRYEMSSKVHDTLGIPITYVVSNPSSYAYPDSSRPAGTASCANYDQWPYGFQGRTGYTGKIPDEQLKRQLAARRTVYLLGEIDILPLGGFDSSCSAMAQGPTRLARGEAFAKYAAEKFGARHQTQIVHLCGHNARCMYTSEEALPILFPKK